MQVVQCENLATSEPVAVKVIKNLPAYHRQAQIEIFILKMVRTAMVSVECHDGRAVCDVRVFSSSRRWTWSARSTQSRCWIISRFTPISVLSSSWCVARECEERTDRPQIVEMTADLHDTNLFSSCRCGSWVEVLCWKCFTNIGTAGCLAISSVCWPSRSWRVFR